MKFQPSSGIPPVIGRVRGGVGVGNASLGGSSVSDTTSGSRFAMASAMPPSVTTPMPSAIQRSVGFPFAPTREFAMSLSSSLMSSRGCSRFSLEARSLGVKLEAACVRSKGTACCALVSNTIGRARSGAGAPVRRGALSCATKGLSASITSRIELGLEGGNFAIIASSKCTSSSGTSERHTETRGGSSVQIFTMSIGYESSSKG